MRYLIPLRISINIAVISTKNLYIKKLKNMKYKFHVRGIHLFIKAKLIYVNHKL